MKKLLFAILLNHLFFASLFAQEASVMPSPKKLNATAFIGMPLTIHQLPNFAMGISVNPTYTLNKWLSAEAQASYTFIDFCHSNNFFGHAQGIQNYVNVLVGPRVYLMKPDNKNRIYVNALLGYGYMYETRSLVPDVLTDNSASISLGTYLELKNKFVLGGSIEGPLAHFEFRFGYKFLK
jgi:hypothetical protein